MMRMKEMVTRCAIERNRLLYAGAVMLFCVTAAAGCTIEETDTSKISDVDYTVVSDEEIPQELMTQIEDGCSGELKLTYSDGEYLYIVRGYGEQPAGSSIQVLDLYQTTNALCIDTQLLGSGENKENQTTSAYPYIVVKLPSSEQNVVFE